MKDRIFKVMKWTGLNLSQFAEAIQVSPALLSSVKSERTKPTLLLLENIKNEYPDVDINWLITGKGDMILGNSSSGLQILANNPAPDMSSKTEHVTPASLEDSNSPIVESQPNRAPSTNSVSQIAEVKQPPVEPTPVAKNVKHLLLLYTDGTYETYEKSL